MPSLVIYLIMLVIYKLGELSDKRIKYFLLASTIIVFTISGIWRVFLGAL